MFSLGSHNVSCGKVDGVLDFDSEAHLEAVDFHLFHLLQVGFNLVRPSLHIYFSGQIVVIVLLCFLVKFFNLSLVNLLDLGAPNCLKPVNCTFIPHKVLALCVLNFWNLFEKVRAVFLHDKDVKAGNLLRKLVKFGQTFTKVGNCLLAKARLLIGLSKAIDINF